jgi:hypothetical protein
MFPILDKVRAPIPIGNTSTSSLMENQLFYHPTSREFRARGGSFVTTCVLAHRRAYSFHTAVPQSLDSNAPLADGSRHMQVQMEQKSTDAFLFAANLIHLELCQQVERLLVSVDACNLGAPTNCLLDDLPVLNRASVLLRPPSDIGDGEAWTIYKSDGRKPFFFVYSYSANQCRLQIADLAHVPHPTPALVSTQLAVTHDIEHSSSTVDKNSEIMRRMWRKFRAAEWIGKAVNI